MIERTLLIIWGIWLLVILVAAFRVFGFLFERRRQDRRWGNGTKNQQPVALILPVKGFDLQATPRFFDSIFAQNYRDYRVIVCFESWDDPVAVWLCEHLEVGPGNPVWTHPEADDGLRSVTLICAGVSMSEGQKVHNQIAAFRDLTGNDAVIAFADADIVCGPDWLARLVAPINQGTHPLASTYRWLVPKRPTLPNQLASVINGSITTQGGGELTNVLWGGSMAISRTVFDELDVPSLFAGSLNDDLRLAKAARKAGHKIAFVRSLIIPTVVDFNWRTFFEFTKRQYTQVKFFSPILYTGINLVLGFYVLGAATIIAALVYGYFYAWIPVAAAYVIDQFRALARQQVYLSLFPENGIRQKLFAAGWLEHMLTPFWIILHWLLLASTWTQNRITWAGITYRIHSISKTQILHRPAITDRLPAGAPGLAMLGSLHDRKRGRYTQPIIPVTTRAEEQPITFTTATDDTTGVTVLAAGEAATVRDSDFHSADTLPIIPIIPVVTSTPEEAPGEIVTKTEPARDTIPAPRLCHPGGQSAVIPLTSTFYERPTRTPEGPNARERGRFSAAEVALSKSRVQNAVFYQVVPIAVPSSAPSSAPVKPDRGTTRPAHPFVGEPISPILSSAEILRTKTRLEGAISPAREQDRLHPPISLASRAEALANKTRVRTGTFFPVPTSRNPIISPASTPASVAPVVTKSPVDASSSSATIAWPPSRSLAARRTNVGGGRNGIGCGPPALSARVDQASRAVESMPSARPGTRRPSGRPR